MIDRPEQMTFEGAASSHGLFAPTIRHHNGTFYVACTRVGAPEAPHHGNFLVTAEDPAGAWSDPVWLTDELGTPVDGIDPSIFFPAAGTSTEGRIWLHGTRPISEPSEATASSSGATSGNALPDERRAGHEPAAGTSTEGQTEVWLREYDSSRGLVIGEEHIIWTGAVRGAVWAEGPHLFEHEGRFYLLAAEGGTEFHHAVCIAHSSSVTGPYQGNRANPVLTHRHLGHPGHGEGPEVVGVGHADLVQGPEGSWWAVLLGMRPYGGYHYNLGRETFLVPVHWQDGWPVFAPGEGQVPAEVDIPFVNNNAAPRTSPQHVTGGVIPPEDYRWSSLHGPWDSFAEPQGSGWRIAVQPATPAERTTPSFLGVRQQHQSLDLVAELDLSELAPGKEAGVVGQCNTKGQCFNASDRGLRGVTSGRNRPIAHCVVILYSRICDHQFQAQRTPEVL